MNIFVRSLAYGALFMLLASCGSKNGSKAEEQEVIDEMGAEEQGVIDEACAEEQEVIAEEDSIVYYLYAYPYAENSPAEDNILELQFRKGAVIDGYFWGTSDEFFEAREGFLPGFFVLRLKDVEQEGEHLSFTLDSREMKYLNEPVSVDFHSVDEALESGGQPWGQLFPEAFQDTARYNATFTPDGIIIHKDKSQYPYLEDHSFVKTSKEAIKIRRNSLID